MTTVCPALLPPWYLTTKSTLSPSKSVALPLPSSPHWAPTITMAGMTTRLARVGSPASEPALRGASEAARRQLRAFTLEYLGGRGTRLAQELPDPLDLFFLADRGGGGTEEMQCPQEALVRLVLPRDRPVAVPAGPPQLVQAAVIPGPGIRICRDRVAGQRLLREDRPRGAVRREPGSGLARILHLG